VNVAHFDCFSGISGDMVLGALIDAGVDADALRTALDSLGLPLQLRVERVKRGGFAATRAIIDADDQESHRFLPDVEAILARGQLTDRQRERALRIFRRLAEAEAAVHGMPIEKVHFHEVGALDSIADIVGSAVGLDLLGVDRFTSRSVTPGGGTVKCAHGLMPVPTPATAHLLRGVPLGPSPVAVELTTPTGAAILTTVVNEWTDRPVMTIDRIGLGAGYRDFPEHPNLLRLFVGTTPDQPTTAERDRVWVLETNLDDVPGEIIGYCLDRVFAAGALDAFCVPVQMKKNRPGVLLTVIAAEADVATLETILMRETATFGVRRTAAERTTLQREACERPTPWGPVRAKRGWRADGFTVVTPEYDDCARVAREAGVPLREVYEAARRGT
jgi:uncharacterized protein (TIGR00299 family) protein